MATRAERRFKTCTAKKESLFTVLQTLLDLSKKLNDPVNVERFKVLYRSLETTRSDLLKLIDQIVEINYEITQDYEPDFAIVRTIDEMCCYINAAAEEIAEKKSNTISARNLNSNKLPKLPKIELPEFSGNIREWGRFYSIFNNLIHDNNALTDVDKIYYLIGKLKGSALSLCSGIPPTGENYNIIWQNLVDKYQDKRALANSYLEQVIDFKSLSVESCKNLDLFLERFDTAVQALQQLGVGDLSDFMLMYLALSKLDSETVRLFELSRDGSAMPTYSDVVKFVKEQSKILANNRRNLTTKSSGTSEKQRTPKAFLVNQNNKDCNMKVRKRDTCIFCNQSWHYMDKCEKFKKLDASERYNTVKNSNWCYNCLSPNHRVSMCNIKRNCVQCGKRHHYLLHFGRPTVSETEAVVNSKNNDITPVADNTTNSDSVCSTMTNDIKDSSTVLLSTVVVNVVNSVGKQTARFLLDSGSQAHLLTVNCCKRLGLSVSKFHSSIQGLGSNSYPIKGVSTMIIASRHDASARFEIRALLVDRISERLPKVVVNLEKLSHLKLLPLADEAFFKPGHIDGIIGADLFPILLGNGRMTGSTGTPIAIETAFGYTIMGTAPTNETMLRQHTFLTIGNHSSLEKMVGKFWELEEVPKCNLRNIEDMECDKDYVTHYHRDSRGRFAVALPFKLSADNLGDSKVLAKSRLLSLERRFARNPELRVEYNKTMQDFIAQGHMQRVPTTNFKGSSYYIPHHAVLKPDSTSTPLRVVFDASAISTSGCSLNDLLYTGPKLQTDIFKLLINFRLFRFAVTADIRQMYRQINIIPDHHRFQRLYWRFKPDEEIDTYELKTVAFGVKSSPYLALRTVQQLVEEEQANFKVAGEIISRDLYMDDLVTSLPTVEAVMQLYKEATELFAAGKFELTKWSTNAKELLESIPSEKQLLKPVTFKLETKILGLQWDSGPDVLCFNLQQPGTLCTKRAILSTVAKCYDPIGLLAPFIMHLKCLVKRLWMCKIDWDETPPEEILLSWSRVRMEWLELQNIKISRHLMENECDSVMLIGFSDASNDGYGAVVYLRVCNENNEVTVKLVCAKSRVAPMKHVTIPRLELCGALLLSKLLKYVGSVYGERILISDIFAFTDSLTVLQWLCSSNLKDVFVLNRITQIKDSVPEAHWRHIAGKTNPADILSRGATPAQLISHPTWINGPLWVSDDVENWPVNLVTGYEQSVATKISLIAENAEENHPLYELIIRKSSWMTILRTTVWVLRFLKLLPVRETVWASDLIQAEFCLIKQVQLKHFHREIHQLKAGKECSNKLRKLRPFIQDGLLRVGGRLTHADIEPDRKHPLLLPGKDPFVVRLIDYYHQKYLHTGAYLLDSILRQKYWILSARSVVRSRVHACNRCFKTQPRNTIPLMADLPKFRVQPSKPFTHTGVDYFGPINITLGKRRGAQVFKAYVCLFICMSVKAIHLELVSSLATDHFLQAFKRFLSRRGPCSIMYSDRGTNFVGAKALLNQLDVLLSSEEHNKVLDAELTAQGIEWRLNPASAPHMGGLWESNVKSTKRHIYRVLGDQLLTYEEFITLLTQVECLLNSRPLCRLSDDTSAPAALTPAHFLTLSPLRMLPADYDDSVPLNRLTRFQLIDRMIHDFWKRWHLEYLSNLQVRQKWDKHSPDLKIGTVVVIKTDNAPPLHWPLAIITNIHPGSDGMIRVATVKTQKGTVTRPVVKLCPLPTQ